MPYNYDPNLDPNQQPQGGNPSGQIAGGSGIIGGAAAGSGGMGGTAPTHSGTFQNLNSYLDANAGNGFGQQFLDQVNQNINQAGTAQQQGLQNFQQASDAGSVKPDPTLVNQAMSNPSGFVSDPNNVAQWNKQYNAQYSGPKQYSDDQSDYSKAQGATQKAQDTAQAANTESGRFGLLNNYFGNANYSQGQQSLDNLLLQGDSTTQQGLRQAQANANQQQQGFNNVQNQANSYAGNNQTQTQAANDNSRNAASGAYNQYKTDLANTTAARQKEIPLTTDQYSNLSSIHNFNQSGDPLSNLGVSANDFKATTFGPSYEQVPAGYFYGADPSRYYNQVNSSQISPSSVATADQAKQIQALEKLQNISAPYLDPNLVGKYSSGPLENFDKSGFLGEVGTKQTAFENAEKNAFDPNASQADQINALNTVRQQAGLPQLSAVEFSSGNPVVYNPDWRY